MAPTRTFIFNEECRKGGMEGGEEGGGREGGTGAI